MKQPQNAFASESLNEWAGWGSGVMIFQPFLWFRYFHLMHHRYTISALLQSFFALRAHAAKITRTTEITPPKETLLSAFWLFKSEALIALSLLNLPQTDLSDQNVDPRSGVSFDMKS